MNVTGAYALHHWIPWRSLLDVLQHALAGTVDPRVVGHLLMLSPRPARDLATRFAAAAHQFRIGGPFQRGQGQVIAEVEQELFSLPCNLFQGLSNRADDPANLGLRFMDFTPGDILSTGSLPEGTPGELQRARERLFALAGGNHRSSDGLGGMPPMAGAVDHARRRTQLRDGASARMVGAGRNAVHAAALPALDQRRRRCPNSRAIYPAERNRPPARHRLKTTG